ncbi:MAG: electron transfer flavoprotein subunit beta/FixA family protein [Bacillota bacterium]|jgi:electron transfer flavoprotein beta subunit
MPFNIIVCLKAVPDPEKASSLTMDPKTKTLRRGQVPLVINPLDKNALEAGLELKELYGGKVTVLSMGPPEAADCLKEALALGADEAVLLSDPAFAGADAHATAFTLAAAVKKLEPFRLVLCGKESSDGSTNQVGPRLAQMLGIPVVTGVFAIQHSQEDRWQVKARIEFGSRTVSLMLPALLTVTRELNTPRLLSFSGIRKAQKKQVTIWSREDLGLLEEQVGLSGSPTIMDDWQPLLAKRKGQMITGTKEEIVEFLFQKMTEAGVL